jgi:hypothetical protein
MNMPWNYNTIVSAYARYTQAVRELLVETGSGMPRERNVPTSIEGTVK